MGKKATNSKPVVPAKPAAKPLAENKPVAGKRAPARATPAKPGVATKRAAKSLPPKAPGFTTDEIALRAYFISEKRRLNGIPGDERHDWLEAERQLCAENGSSKSLRRTKVAAN